MKTFLLFFITTTSQLMNAQQNDPVLFSTDGKYIFSFDSKVRKDFKSRHVNIYYKDTVYQELHAFEYIIKDDTIFNCNRAYYGQPGEHFKENNKESSSWIFDTLTVNELFEYYGFKKNEWVFPTPVIFSVDTIKILENNSGNLLSNNEKIIDSNFFTFNIEFIYDNQILNSTSVNSSANYYVYFIEQTKALLYFDKKRNTYFLNARIHYGVDYPDGSAGILMNMDKFEPISINLAKYPGDQ
ncbi:MAG: hypothetical protein ACHQFW_00870 [Chitinophagales bacterium]